MAIDAFIDLIFADDDDVIYKDPGDVVIPV